MIYKEERQEGPLCNGEEREGKGVPDAKECCRG